VWVCKFHEIKVVHYYTASWIMWGMLQRHYIHCCFFRYSDVPQIGTRIIRSSCPSHIMCLSFSTPLFARCCPSCAGVPVGLPLELDIQKEETMRALLVLLVFVPHDAQLAIEEQVIVVCHTLLDRLDGPGVPMSRRRHGAQCISSCAGVDDAPADEHVAQGASRRSLWHHRTQRMGQASWCERSF